MLKFIQFCLLVNKHEEPFRKILYKISISTNLFCVVSVVRVAPNVEQQFPTVPELSSSLQNYLHSVIEIRHNIII